MHISVRNVLERKLFATCSEVAICVPVTLEVAIDCAHQSEGTDVELAALVEERFFDVLLHDVGPLVAVDVRVLDQALDVIQVSAHLYPAAPVRVFARFNDPNVLTLLGVVV